MNDAIKQISVGLADAVEKAGVCIVTVSARHRLPASGIALDNETILTAAHVIEDDENITVILPDGKKLGAELLGYDPRSDLAALKLEAPEAAPAVLGGEAAVGQLVLALGRPFSRGVEASLGVISAKSGPSHTHGGGILEAHYRTDAVPYPGFSGGPLVDVEGKVLGINTSGLGIGNSVVIPIQVALKVVEMLKEHGTVKRGYLGISGQPVELSEDAQKALGRAQESGLLLVDVEEDGPAQKGGLVISDILVGVGGEAVTSHGQLLASLTGHLVGQEVDVEVLRGGQPKTLNVEIGERPEMPAEERFKRQARRFYRRMHQRGHHSGPHGGPHHHKGKGRGKHRRGHHDEE